MVTFVIVLPFAVESAIRVSNELDLPEGLLVLTSAICAVKSYLFWRWWAFHVVKNDRAIELDRKMNSFADADEDQILENERNGHRPSRRGNYAVYVGLRAKMELGEMEWNPLNERVADETIRKILKEKNLRLADFERVRYDARFIFFNPSKFAREAPGPNCEKYISNMDQRTASGNH
jgi:hypothetical protein